METPSDITSSGEGRAIGPSTSADDTDGITSLANILRSRFRLSPMEALVACALADGLTYREIAGRFRISYHTAHSHVKAIHTKADVKSNGQLLALVRRMTSR